MENCSICHNVIIDKVFMTCMPRHEFCFSCIIKSVEATNQLKSCPLCRGGDKYIMIDNCVESMDENSLCMFKKMIPILRESLKIKETNSCLISEKLLVHFIRNKKQLKSARILLDNGLKPTDVVDMIKWNEDIDNFMNSLGTTIFREIGRYPFI